MSLLLLVLHGSLSNTDVSFRNDQNTLSPQVQVRSSSDYFVNPIQKDPLSEAASTTGGRKRRSLPLFVILTELAMKLFGLTGGIACGKSTVATQLASSPLQDVTVIDCDALVRELQEPGTVCFEEMRACWPQAFDRTSSSSSTGPPREGGKGGNYTLNRAVLADVVFSDGVQRRRLARIMNRRIFFAILHRLVVLWWSKPASHIVILDAPLLFENGVLTWLIAGAVVVSADRETQVARLSSRNQLGRVDAEKRIDAQMPVTEKARRAAYVIVNGAETSKEELVRRAEDALIWLRKQRVSTFVRPGWSRALFAAGFVTAAVLALTVAVVSTAVSRMTR